jgi:hypothetical protein
MSISTLEPTAGVGPRAPRLSANRWAALRSMIRRIGTVRWDAILVGFEGDVPPGARVR